jgi:hypothetical protein
MIFYRVLNNFYHLISNKTKKILIYKYFIHLLHMISVKYIMNESKSSLNFKKLVKNKKYKFTVNNIGQSIDLLENLKKKLNGQKLNVLILGCFEGMTSIYFLNNFNIKKIHCVDIWDVDIYKKSKSKPNIFAESYFDKNLSRYKSYKKYRLSTDDFFKKSILDLFDIIYIDASHFYLDVARDAFNADKKLKNNSYLIFNSILWRSPKKNKKSNLAGINIFLKKKYQNYDLISISANLLILKKTI